MLSIGQIFTDGGLTYKVIDTDAQGRAISTLVSDDEMNKTPLEQLIEETEEVTTETESELPAKSEKEEKKKTTTRKKA